MKCPSRKCVLAAIVVIAAAATLRLRTTVSAAPLGPDATKEETAHILVHDRKFGSRAKQKAVEYGDAILPLIQKETFDFTKLDNRNAFWIAEVLGSIETDRSRAILLDLYARKDPLTKLTGAVGLAQQKALPESIAEDSFLVQTVRQEIDEAEMLHDNAKAHLAIIALGKSGEHAALPCLLDILRKRPNEYSCHAYACEALARIDLKEAIPILKECLQDPEFYALPSAFRALVSLGDREAVPLAITRVSPELKGYSSGYVVKELTKVTGQSYGYDSQAWNDWWDGTKDTWGIPDQFLKPWDEQEDLY